MKRRSILLLAAALLALALLTVTASAARYLKGDVNNDGEITAADARLSLRASVRLEPYTDDSPEFAAADADGDHELTPGDARMILRASVHLEELADTGMLVKKTNDYSIELLDWDWDLDEMNNPYVSVYFLVENTSDKDEDFFFSPWAVNGYMTPLSFCTDGQTILPPGRRKILTSIVTGDETSPDYSLTPAVLLEFEANVATVANDGEDYHIIGTDHFTAGIPVTDGPIRYEAPYADRAFTVANNSFRYFQLDSTLRNWYGQNEELDVTFLYQNLSAETQMVEVEITAVNGISTLDEYGMGIRSSFPVFAGCYAQPLAMLYYDFMEPERSLAPLNVVGVTPEQIQNVSYILRVIDEANGEEIYHSDETLLKIK